jgi:hypothetical protein
LARSVSATASTGFRTKVTGSETRSLLRLGWADGWWDRASHVGSLLDSHTKDRQPHELAMRCLIDARTSECAFAQQAAVVRTRGAVCPIDAQTSWNVLMEQSGRW